MVTRPRSKVDKPIQSDNLLPEGTLLFKILTPTNERVRVIPHDELPEFMTSDVNSFSNKEQVPHFTGDAEETNVWLGQASPADDESPDVGDKIFFQSFVTADGPIKINDLEQEPDGEGQKIRWSKNLDLFFNLADALGATYDESGEVAISEDFCEMLQSGDFDDKEVIATIEHYIVKKGPNAGDERHRLIGFQAV